MNMEFLYANYINTTTMVKVNNGSTSVQYLFDRDKSKQFSSSGDNSDLTTTTIDIEFTTSRNVDHIILENINWKSFVVAYNSNTANTFTLTQSTEGTLTSAWQANSATSLYLYFATTAVNSIRIQASTTISANQEKKCGQIWISGQRYQLEFNPSYNNYKPKTDRKEFTHEMAGGGWINYIVGDHFTGSVKLQHITDTERVALKTLYDAKTEIVFVPYPTATSWTGEIYQVNWIGDWSFLQASGNNWIDAGWEGTIDMREVPKA